MLGVTPPAAAASLADLGAEERAGQGIVIGLGADGDTALQVSWTSGMVEGLQGQDPATGVVAEPVDGRYVIANGGHAESVVAAMREGRPFAAAFADTVGGLEGTFTVPKLAGALVLPDGSEGKALGGYEFSLAREGAPSRTYYADVLEVAGKGLGRCINTYLPEGELESFAERPYEVLPLGRDIEDTADMYWASINAGAGSALVVRSVDLTTGETNQRVTRWVLGPTNGVSPMDAEGATR